MLFIPVEQRLHIKSLLRRILTCVLILLGFYRMEVCAQVGTMNAIPNPQSPNVAALAKFVEMPVSYYNGLPSITVPLYQLKTKDVEVPITLSYHASGLKVKEVPGWVGAGWSLSAGGVITRIIRGVADDHINTPAVDTPNAAIRRRLKAAYQKGFSTEFNESMQLDIIYHSPGWTTELFAGDQKWDTEMDLYYYNFMGNTGRFTFSNDGKVIMLPNSDLRVTYENQKFNITDTRGIVYNFDAIEKTNGPGQDGDPGGDYIASWYLTKIHVPYSQQSIEFRYRKFFNAELYTPEYYLRNGNVWNTTTGVRVKDFSSVSVVPEHAWKNNCVPITYGGGSLAAARSATALFPDTILFNNDTIRFYSNTNRSDAYRIKLDSISIQHGKKKITTITFGYDYFNKNGSELEKKLKLDAVKVNDQRFSFSYMESINGIGVPSILSAGEDIWGYYNAEPPVGLERPRYKAYSLVSPDLLGPLNSTHINPDAKYAQLGTLSSITYPTGGKTNFEYEGNDYSIVPGLANVNDLTRDAATQLVFDSLYSKSVAATRSRRGPNVPSANNDIILHHAQMVKISGGLGLNFLDLTYNDYLTLIKGQYYSASLSILKYNDSTKQFVTVKSYSFVPEEVLGDPGNEDDFEYMKASTFKLINDSISLPEGKYRLSATVWGPEMDAYQQLALRFSYKKEPFTFNAGGLRIKKISFDSYTSNVPSYVKKYEYRLGSGSSGVLESPFSNASVSAFIGEPRQISTGTDYVEVMEVCNFIDISSSPVIPLGNSQGGVIGYAQVREISEDGSYKDFHFTNGGADIGAADGFSGNGYGFAQTRTRIKKDNSWKRGLLTQQDYYNNSNKLVRQDFHRFDFVDLLKDTAVSLYLEPVISQYRDDAAVIPDYALMTSMQAIKRMDSIVTVTPAGTLSNVTRYTHNPDKYTFPVEISSMKSDGSLSVTSIKYPLDYNIGNTPQHNVAISIKNLLNHNMKASPIEKIIQVKDKNGNVRIVAAEHIRYHRNIPVVDSVFAFSAASGISNYQPVSVDGSNYQRNAAFEFGQTFTNYDAYGNVVEQISRNGIKEALIWGYDHQYLIAKIVGASYNDVISGINMTVLNNPANDDQLRSEINKIRTRFSGSGVQIMSYTYAPLIGITSVSDVNNVTSYFEYDSSNRLKLIKDQNGKIIKLYEYKYQAPIAQ